MLPEVDELRRQADAALRARAARVIPGGMYGHQSAAKLPSPQFVARAQGSRVWDVDGNEYIDLMSAYGPVVLGHRHPRVEEAAWRQAREADCLNAPSPRMVELAEALTEAVSYANWAIFAKNGTDATTLCVTIARAATGRRKVLIARGSYHGAAAWCTPGSAGVIADDKRHVIPFEYNDERSLAAALEAAGGDLAAIVITPIRHDLGMDLESPAPSFAAAVRHHCDQRDALLILDEVRAGYRLSYGSSWDYLGVEPDLSAWSKALANGYPLAAVLGGDRVRDAAAEVYTTGSFWFAAVPMAAAIATREALIEEMAIEQMDAAGTRLCAGLRDQARSYDLEVTVSGPPQMPFMTFAGDSDGQLAYLFAQIALEKGVWLHPYHNWFMSAALTEGEIDSALTVTDQAFEAVARSTH